MHIVALAWMFVVLLMTAAEASAPSGTLLGAFFTLLLYGVLPLSVLLYILGTPARKRRLRGVAAQEAQQASAAQPDGRGHAAGDPLAPEREEA